MPILADRLCELENGMPIDEIGRRGLSMLTALKAVHALDLVHRDLKPENIFSTDQPTVTRIFDFGLVKPPAGAPQQDTTVGTFMGTPEYMAPEQLDSSAPVDRARRHLRHRRGVLRDAGRAAAVLGERRRGSAGAGEPARAAAVALRRERSARARGRHPPLSGQGSGTPLHVDRRAGGGVRRRRWRSPAERGGAPRRPRAAPPAADARLPPPRRRPASRWRCSRSAACRSTPSTRRSRRGAATSRKRVAAAASGCSARRPARTPSRARSGWPIR